MSMPTLLFLLLTFSFENMAIDSSRNKNFTVSELEKLNDNQAITRATVVSKDQKQTLDFYSAGQHPSKCRYAMRKLSQYENYSEYVDFITQSSYDDRAQKIRLKFDSSLLPYSFILRFKIPRIKDQGSYPFTFEEGFLKGLLGEIILRDTASGCFMEVVSEWHGPHTKINNLVFEIFLKTLGKLGMEKLIRISRY